MSLQFFVTETDDAVGANGDYAIVFAQRMYVGPKANGTWSGAARYSTLGPSGPGLVYGSGAPASGTGSDGQVYVDTQTFNAYGPKASGSWGGVTKSLVGAAGATGATGTAGSQIYFDKAEPGITLGLAGDFFIRTDTSNLYYKVTSAYPATTSDYPNGWKIIGALKGATGATGAVGSVGPSGPMGAQGPIGSTGASGAPGFSTQSGSGAPSSSTGNAGDIYVDTAAGNLYPAKTSSGWSSAFKSLVGPAGAVGSAGATGPAGAVGPAGPASPSITSGTGAPTSNNPGGTIQPGSFYIQTDTTPNRLFGPYVAATGWPSGYTAMGGGNLLSTSGPPANTAGSVGDCAIDTVNGFFYPTKQAAGWTSAPINLVGPTGPAGYTTLPAAAIVPGQCMSVNALALSATPYVVPIPGTAMPAYFKSPTQSALMGLGVTCNGAAVTMELYDQTAGVSVYTKAIAVTTDNLFGPFASNAYPMTPGNTHVWRLTGSGTTTVSATPFYLQPSSQNVAAACPVTGFTTPANTAFTSTSTATYAGGSTAQNTRRHYFFRAGSIVNMVATYVPSNANTAAATVTVTLYTYTVGASGTVALMTSATIPNTGLPVVLGPYAAGTYTVAANSMVFANVQGSGTGQVNVDLNVVV